MKIINNLKKAGRPIQQHDQVRSTSFCLFFPVKLIRHFVCVTRAEQREQRERERDIYRVQSIQHSTAQREDGRGKTSSTLPSVQYRYYIISNNIIQNTHTDTHLTKGGRHSFLSWPSFRQREREDTLNGRNTMPGPASSSPQKLLFFLFFSWATAAAAMQCRKEKKKKIDRLFGEKDKNIK